MKLLSAYMMMSFVTLTTAIKLPKRENPRVARLDIERYEVQDPLSHDGMRKRQKTVQQTVDNVVTSYFANVSIGTPAQNFRLFINTGASDMWVNTPKSTLCSTNNSCADSGTYNANLSSTYIYVNGAFMITYIDGDNAGGDHATDTLRIGGQTVQDMQFGIAYNSTSSEGLLGIGYAIDEAQVSGSKLAPYPNLPQKLAKDGKINSVAYSLWLNDPDASTGSILFGGVDTTKYTGGLRPVPIIPTNAVYSAFNINLTAIGQNGTYNLMNSSSITALLESGTSLSYLPSNITTPLYQQINATYDTNRNAAFVDCKLSSRPGTIDFSFSGTNISVPLKTLVIPYGTSRGQPICIFGISPMTERNSVATLGITFLRAAYVVFDLDNNQISLAQTRFNVTTENIVEIARGRDGVPTSVYNTPTSTPTSSGSGGTVSITSKPTDNSGGNNDSSNGLSTGAKAGIGVGVVAGVALLVGAALLLFKRRRKTHAQPSSAKPPTAQVGGDLPEFMGRS